MVSLAQRPSGASREAESLGLLVDGEEPSSSDRFPKLSDFGCLARLQFCPSRSMPVLQRGTSRPVPVLQRKLALSLPREARRRRRTVRWIPVHHQFPSESVHRYL